MQVHNKYKGAKPRTMIIKHFAWKPTKVWTRKNNRAIAWLQSYSIVRGDDEFAPFASADHFEYRIISKKGLFTIEQSQWNMAYSNRFWFWIWS